ncbi:MAG: energy-dependent translational throttle protein EttA [Kiritimatiellae bacterium]|jgi:sulfate-transporting ATPase|nr:energy-dependent translational throttle protein EttA [Kiritimatiellia bacterium]
MAQEFIFHMEDVSKSYGDKMVLDGINLSFFYGAKIGIVGDNGSGKSTLLKIMAGLDKDFKGSAELVSGMRVTYVPQEPQLNMEKDVRGNIEEGLERIQSLIDRYDEITDLMAEDLPDGEMDALMNEMGDIQDKIDLLDGWEMEHLLDVASDALVLPPNDADVRTLSGGERRRVALCKALLEKPDLLLLDEPTNHLDAETVAWLEQTLREYHGTVIIVTHDRYFLDNITKWILELEDCKGYPFQGNYSSWLEQKQEILRRIEKRETERQRILSRELDWINNAHKGRRQKNNARIERYDELVNQNFEIKQNDITIQIPPGNRLGNKVINLKGVSKSYDDLELLKNLDLDVPAGAIVGVIGPNGIGKTTLFRMIVGEETPDSGTVEIGDTVQLSYVDQHRDLLDDSKTIFEEVCNDMDEVELGSGRMNSRAYLSRFNFKGAQQQKEVGKLSGGERNRVHLAKLLRSGGNVIMLDEPTNDLDVNTMRVLEEALMNFPGCVLITSHDRFFLDRLCTHLLIFEGAGKTTWFEGNFQDYTEKVLMADSNHLKNRRNKYKKIKI